MDYEEQLREYIEFDEPDAFLAKGAGERYSYPQNGIPPAVRPLTDEEEILLSTPCLRQAQ